MRYIANGHAIETEVSPADASTGTPEREVATSVYSLDEATPARLSDEQVCALADEPDVEAAYARLLAEAKDVDARYLDPEPDALVW